MLVTRFVPLIALAGALVAPFPAVAQSTSPAPAETAAPMAPAPHAHHRHHRSFMHALNAVDLSATQKQQIATFRDQAKSADLNADPAAKKANAANLRRQIMGILTPDQKTQLTAALHRPARSEGGSPMPAPSPTN